jgi:hypothetical protein
VELVVRYPLLYAIEGSMKSTVVIVESRNILSLASKGFRERERDRRQSGTG